jgi:eukaryotic-like serine/threonine-protein kinase
MDTQVADIVAGALVAGRYRVRGLTRRGPVSVHTAVDERLDRPVTLKVVHPSRPGGNEIAERFVDDARAIAQLTHPGVVACFDQGVHNGLPYLVMEHVPAGTLREVLVDRGRLGPVEALAITEQLLAAVAAAHRVGLVHRDVRPEHVLIAPSPSGGLANLVDGVVKVTDFGLAHAMWAAGGDDADLATSVAYMAPELVAEGHADARSDVYSIGIALFEMLTGQVPYHGGTPEEVAWQHVDHDVPHPSTWVPGIPAAVDDLVARATTRNPAARPTDAGALLAEVQLVRDGLSAVGKTPPADSTVVMTAVPANERPAWARLPAPKAAPVDERSRSGGARRPPRDPKLAKRQQQALIAAAVAVTLLVLVGGWWFGFGRWMPAPDLLAMSQEEAVAEAERLGLRVELGTPRHSEHVAEGLVLAQDPHRNGRVARGGTVTLTLSLGSEVRQVPNVIGVALEVAKRQLEELGLVVREGEPGYSNTVPAGRVLAVSPEVGSDVRPGDEVEVSASLGRAPIEVPYLIGMHIDQARHELRLRGLEPEVVIVDSDRPAGEVIEQEPGPGGGAEEGGTVRLQVSEGPPTVPVPDVMGQRCRDAVPILESAGFKVETRGPDRRRVTEQNPSPGTGLPPGETVTLRCG